MILSFREVWNLRKNTKGALFILFFRISHSFTGNRLKRILGFPLRAIYKLLMQWFLGIDIPDTTRIGKELNVYHGQGLVVHENTIIGDYCILRQNTTIGNAKEGSPAPVIGNHVEVGANCVILGNVNVGECSVIAAGSVVIKDVPAYVMVAGNPAQLKKTLNKVNLKPQDRIEA